MHRGTAAGRRQFLEARVLDRAHEKKKTGGVRFHERRRRHLRRRAGGEERVDEIERRSAGPNDRREVLGACRAIEHELAGRGDVALAKRAPQHLGLPGARDRAPRGDDVFEQREIS
jgi:hypothetical protein